MRTFVSVLVGTLFLAALGYGLPGPHSRSVPSPVERTTVQPVNAVLGNASYRALFGTAPSPDTPERLRLQTHLAYVESLLRSRPRPSLSPAQKARRSTLLDALHDYWTRGHFPQNTEVPGRSPVFIDANGRRCAVRHLIAVSAGAALANTIDQQFHYAHIRDIHHPALNRWAERNGFTRQELALIQPQYDDDPCCILQPGPQDDDASALEIAALAASIGTSLVNGTLNGLDRPSIVGGTAGLAGGATSLALGFTGDAKYPTADATVGAAAVALGGWTLISALRPSSNPTSSGDSGKQDLNVIPTTLTTVDGSTYPGVRATIQF